MEEYIENGYSIIKYANGTTIKQLIPQEPNQDTIVGRYYQPTNTEIAQQIEDLRADLMIAGVI